MPSVQALEFRTQKAIDPKTLHVIPQDGTRRGSANYGKA